VKRTEDGFLVANVALRIHYKVSDGRKNGVVIVFSRSLNRSYGGFGLGNASSSVNAVIFFTQVRQLVGLM
jgi:hypothetical protein